LPDVICAEALLLGHLILDLRLIVLVLKLPQAE
jgi:hypothetical protein